MRIVFPYRCTDCGSTEVAHVWANIDPETKMPDGTVSAARCEPCEQAYRRARRGVAYVCATES